MAEAAENGEVQLVVFVMETEEFACSINNVREVLKMIKVTPLPRSLDFVEGVINMRGEVIPVIDLRKRFGLPDAERTDNSRIIIVEVEERMVGLIVDSVSEVISLSSEQIQEAPSQVAGGKTDLITGVGKVDDRMLIILDLNRILTSEEQIALEDVSKTSRQLAGNE
ncbi:MAG: chemotaxis protein CheW [Bacillota bacterium]